MHIKIILEKNLNQSIFRIEKNNNKIIIIKMIMDIDKLDLLKEQSLS